jgi:hypothetical protein
MLRQGSLTAVLILSSLFLFSGCASNNKKAELRDKVVQQSGFMCEFINGDQHRQIEIELNVMMAKRCDTEKPYSVTNYKTSAEVNGILYCCRTKDQTPAKTLVTPTPVSPTTSSSMTTPSTTTSTPTATANSKATSAPDAKKTSTTSTTNAASKPTSTAPKKPADKAPDVELDIEIEPGQ